MPLSLSGKSDRKKQMPLKKPQQSLKDWTAQKWRTKSGKPSTQGSRATGERYLPEKAIKALSPSEYAASTKAKRAGKAAGKQFVKQPARIAKKTAGFR
jgi:SET domain-containing protein